MKKIFKILCTLFASLFLFSFAACDSPLSCTDCSNSNQDAKLEDLGEIEVEKFLNTIHFRIIAPYKFNNLELKISLYAKDDFLLYVSKKYFTKIEKEETVIFSITVPQNAFTTGKYINHWKIEVIGGTVNYTA